MKDYFEYTPSILRVLVEPNQANGITIKHKDYLKNTKVLIDQVIEISEETVKTPSRIVAYEYLVISTGAKQKQLFDKNDKIFQSGDLEEVSNARKELKCANSVLLIGGGIVGIELAGEIIDMFPEKNLTIVHSGDNILPRYPKWGAKYANELLSSKGVKIICKEKISSQTGMVFTTESGKNTFYPDIVFVSVGITPNSPCVSNSHLTGWLNEEGFINVDNHLQVEGLKHIFAVGDVCAINEEKLAQSAQIAGVVVARNIIRTEQSKSLIEYIPVARPVLISLGKFRGILAYKSYGLTGRIPALLKEAVEWKWKLGF